MKAKITSQGYLKIKRKGSWTDQICPFTISKGSERFCGDWCPLFYLQPAGIHDKDGNIPEANIAGYQLYLCHQTYYIRKENFEDKRR